MQNKGFRPGRLFTMELLNLGKIDSWVNTMLTVVHIVGLCDKIRIAHVYNSS